VPHIKIATHRDDVCATCERLKKAAVSDQADRKKKEKLTYAEALRQHILTTQKERDTYNKYIKKATGNDVHVHYTFDFSQHVCLPHHARQMGPAFCQSAEGTYIRIQNRQHT